MESVFYRAWDSIGRHMYEVVMLQWSAAIPGQLDKMELYGMQAPRRSRMVYGREAISHYILMPRLAERDSLGRSIYEGDILGYEGQARGVIYFELGAFKTFDGNFSYHLRDSDLDIAEVLGNIHQHPHLFPFALPEKRDRKQALGEIARIAQEEGMYD